MIIVLYYMNMFDYVDDYQLFRYDWLLWSEITRYCLFHKYSQFNFVFRQMLIYRNLMIYDFLVLVRSWPSRAEHRCLCQGWIVIIKPEALMVHQYCGSVYQPNRLKFLSLNEIILWRGISNVIKSRTNNQCYCWKFPIITLHRG